METVYDERIGRLEREVRRLDREVTALHRQVFAEEAAAPEPIRVPEPPVRRPAPDPVPPPAAKLRLPAPPSIELGDLLGAKALAWIGGAVTLLGVVFFYVLAVNRGWIGPEVRVALGGIASTLALTGGLWLRRRFGATYASLGAVGAGIAGYYATLLAAAELYDLLPDPAALALAAAIAALGVALSLAWAEQILAGLGLIGALAVPALLVPQSGVTRIGTAFAVIVFAGAAAVAIARRWAPLLVVAALGAGGETAALVLKSDSADGRVLAVAGVLCLVALAAGIDWQLVEGDQGLNPVATGLVLGSAGFAFGSAAYLYHGQAGDLRGEGLSLLVVAGFYAVPTLALLRRARDLSALLGALALAVAAVAVADLVSGPTLTYAWAAEAAVLAWLAYRFETPRFQAPAFVYLGLAVVHAAAFEARPSDLFEVSRHPASGVPSLLAVLAASLAVGLLARPWGGETRTAIDRALAPLGRIDAELRAGSLALASLLALDAVGLLVLEAYPESGFHHAHVLVTGLWSLAGLVAVVGSLRRGAPIATTLGLGWLALVLAKVLDYDWRVLEHHTASWSLLLCGAALLAAGFLLRALSDSEEPLTGIAALTSVTALALGVVAAGTLLGFDFESSSNRAFGAGLLGLAAVYAGLGASVFRVARLRGLSRLHWGLAVPVLWVAEALLCNRAGWTFVAWAATAAALAWLSRATGERGFQLAGALVLGTSVLGALIRFTPPGRFWHATEHPASGLWVLTAAVVAATVLALCETRLRAAAVSVAATLGVYGLSLAILELGERISTAGMDTDFQRAHTAVSALWVLLGLGLLYTGLRRSSTSLRTAGFVLFGLSLGKIFLYDLSQLSSVTRALSFIAVGAVFLAAGFFYQRLAADRNGAHA
jgi:uncharacterized membrane protein